MRSAEACPVSATKSDQNSFKINPNVARVLSNHSNRDGYKDINAVNQKVILSLRFKG